MKTYYVTTPIYYVNDKPHIGHAYTSLAADTLARFKRLDGFDVKFITGTDEHGQKIEKAAASKGIECKTFVDEVSKTFKDLTAKLDLTNDLFIRTTDDYHKKTVQKIWEKIFASENIYLGEYSGWYALRDEAFYQEDELVNGKAPTGADVEWVTESSYFFKLSAWQKPLLDFYEKNPKAIMPESRKNEVLRFIEGGLNDLSISRKNLKWGIQVPNDKNHVIYVWLDALTNYLSAINFPENNYKKYWENSIHLVGKDILRFHSVYWPAFLMAAGIEPPKTVFAHGWWTVEGEKMSKSIGNVIDPNEIINEYGADSLRYFLLRDLSFGQDGDFSKNAFITRINTDLANAYGNLCQRVLSFIYKNADAAIPKPEEFSKEDKELINMPKNLIETIKGQIDMFQINRYIETVWNIIAEANRYVDYQKPWDLKKNDNKRMNTVLYTLCDVIKNIAILTQPILPKASDKILNMIGINQNSRNIINLFDETKYGTTIQEPKVLFTKYV